MKYQDLKQESWYRLVQVLFIIGFSLFSLLVILISVAGTYEEVGPLNKLSDDSSILCNSGKVLKLSDYLELSSDYITDLESKNIRLFCYNELNDSKLDDLSIMDQQARIRSMSGYSINKVYHNDYSVIFYVLLALAISIGILLGLLLIIARTFFYIMTGKFINYKE